MFCEAVKYLSSSLMNIVLMSVSDHIMHLSTTFKLMMMPITRNDLCINSVFFKYGLHTGGKSAISHLEGGAAWLSLP